MTAAIRLDLSSRAFGAALIGLVVALSAAAWFVAVAPQRSHASQLAQTIQEKQSTLEAKRHERSSGGSGGVELGRLRTAMPDALDMPQVVDELNALAGEAGVTLDTVTPQAATLGIGYTSVPLTVVVDGHYFGVEQFLHLVRTRVAMAKAKLDADGRLYDVQGVQLEQTEPAPNVTATLTMSVFYYTGAAAPTPASTETTTDGSTTTPTTTTPSS